MTAPNDPPGADPIARGLAVIDVARHVFPKPDVRTMWRDLGLPTPSTTSQAKAPAGPSRGAADVARFFAEACRPDPAADVPAAAAHRAFAAWAEREGIPAIPSGAFGKFARKAGVPSRKAGSTRYQGYHLPREGLAAATLDL